MKKLKFRTVYTKEELEVYKKDDWFGDDNNLGSIAIDLDPEKIQINTISIDDSTIESSKPMTVNEYLEQYSLIRPVRVELSITSVNTSSELNDYEYTDKSMSVASVSIDNENDDMFNKNALHAQEQTKAWINVGEHYPSCNILLYSTMPIFKRLFSSSTDEVSGVAIEFTYEAMYNANSFTIALNEVTTPFSELYNNMIAGTLGWYKEVVRTIDITNSISTYLDNNRLGTVTGTYLDLGQFQSIWLKRESLFNRIFKKNTVDITDLAEMDCPISKKCIATQKNIAGDIIVDYGNIRYSGLHSHGVKLTSYFDHVYHSDYIRLVDYKNDVIANEYDSDSNIIDSIFTSINGNDCIDIDEIVDVLCGEEFNPDGREIILRITTGLSTGRVSVPMQLDLKFYVNKNTGHLCVDWATYIDLYCNSNNPYLNKKQSLLEINSQFNIQVTVDKEYWEGPENAKAASGNHSFSTGDTNQD